MEQNVVIWDYLFIVGFLLLLVLMVFQEVRFSRRLKGQREKSLEALNLLDEQLLASQRKIKQLTDDISEYHTGVLGVGKQIKSIESDIQQLKHRQRELEEQEPEVKMYQKANKLVSAGASVEEIMQACELPRAEAELLINLHNTQKP